MTVVSIADAGTQLLSLVRDASTGEEVILTENGRPVAKLIPVAEAAEMRPRVPGSARTQILYMADDFDAPLDDFAEYS